MGGEITIGDLKSYASFTGDVMIPDMYGDMRSVTSGSGNKIQCPRVSPTKPLSQVPKEYIMWDIQFPGRFMNVES